MHSSLGMLVSFVCRQLHCPGIWHCTHRALLVLAALPLELAEQQRKLYTAGLAIIQNEACRSKQYCSAEGPGVAAGGDGPAPTAGTHTPGPT